MSTAYLELVLDELDLLPLWTRPELLAAAKLAAPAERSVAAIAAVPGEPASTAPVAQRESPTSAPLQRSARPVPATNPAPQPATTATPATAATPERDARAIRIANLDWETLQTEVASCTACGLCKSRNKAVFGVGPVQTDWLVVGEAPGAEEDRQGEPFVGQAGRLLDNMLAAVARSRKENAFILNTLKCRPPQNRNPQPDEMALCAPFLHRQIELLQPKVIFAVGRFAVQALLGSDASIASLRGKRHDYRGIPVVVSYHPAYLLRNLPDKIKAWQDLLLAKKLLAERDGA